MTGKFKRWKTETFVKKRRQNERDSAALKAALNNIKKNRPDLLRELSWTGQ